MGTGSKARKDQVVKERIRPGTVISGGTVTSSGSAGKSNCLFNFTIDIAIKSNYSYSVGESVTLVPNDTNTGIEIYIRSMVVGAYIGNYLNRILGCASEGFIYEGVITNISNKVLKAKIQGLG